MTGLPRRRGGEEAAECDASRLARMLDPRSIAVVGASRDPAKRGHRAIAALLASGYPHPIYPVNRSGGTVGDLPVLTELAAAPQPVDLALVATPAATVPDVLTEVAAAGAAGAIVLAVGFGEAGEEGRRLEDRIARVAADTGLRVIGPNTSGMFNAHARVNLVGVPEVPAGPVSVLTQSGNMLLSIMAEMTEAGGPGFATYVGVGNQIDVRYDELLTALARDPNTGAIAVHCEGFRDGRAFAAAAATTVPHKPVVLLKGGNSAAGSASAASHTGAVAGSAAVAASVLRQAGVEVVERSDELSVITGVLARAPLPAGGRIAVLADGGGHATLAADALSGHGLDLARPSEHTTTRLRRLLGPAASVRNPIDVAGATDADPSLFGECLRLLAGDGGCDLVLVVGLFGGYQTRFGAHLADAEARAARAMVGAARAGGTPLLVQTCYAGAGTEPLRLLRASGIPVLASIDHAARACAALCRRAAHLATAAERASFAASPHRSRRARGSSSPVPLTEPQARRLLADAGIAAGEWCAAGSARQARAAVAGFGRPCALKVVSPQVVHKSEVGGVRVNVTATTAESAYAEMMTAVAAAAPGARIEGALVAPMAGDGVELLVGGLRDPTFGPLLAFGPGGTLVELSGATRFRAVPLTAREAHELLADEPVSRLLDGFRGAPAAERDALAKFLISVGQLLADRDDIVELDLNPVIVCGGKITPVDVRIVVAPTGRSGGQVQAIGGDA